MQMKSSVCQLQEEMNQLTGGGSGITIDTANDTNPNISFTGPVTVSGTVTVTSDNATTDGTLDLAAQLMVLEER